MTTNRITVWLILLSSSLASLRVDGRQQHWPQWMGGDRDGVYHETGIIDSIPKTGLNVKWRTPIAGGYAGPAVADGRVFVFDYKKQTGEGANNPGNRVKLTGEERLTALDEKTGKQIWQQSYDCPYSISYPAGPRCTPTVHDEHVYSLGSEGDLRCFRAKDGEPVWKTNFKQDFGAETPMWGYSSHPLIDGDLLYTLVGGDGQGIVAFDRKTGEVKWKALDAKAGYCPPTIIEHGGTRQLIVFHPQAVVSLDPADGKEYWNVEIEPLYEMSIARPMVDGNLMYASGIRNAGVMIKLDPDKPSATELWRGKPGETLFSANATPLFVDGVLYGTDCNEGCLIAVDGKTGKRLWTTFEPTKPDEKRRLNHGTAFVSRIGKSDRYLLFGENGDLMIANMNRKRFESRGSFHALEPTGEAFGRDVVWSHPAYANRTAYIRNDKEIVAVDIAKKPAADSSSGK